jgi:hypothetical protein
MAVVRKLKFPNSLIVLHQLLEHIKAKKATVGGQGGQPPLKYAGGGFKYAGIFVCGPAALPSGLAVTGGVLKYTAGGTSTGTISALLDRISSRVLLLEALIKRPTRSPVSQDISPEAEATAFLIFERVHGGQAAPGRSLRGRISQRRRGPPLTVFLQSCIN